MCVDCVPSDKHNKGDVQTLFLLFFFFGPFGSTDWDVEPENLTQVSANFNWHDSQDQVFFSAFRRDPIRPGISTTTFSVAVSGLV